MRESVKESIVGWILTLFAVGLLVLLFSAVVAKCATWDRVDDFGGQGQPCYPNRTCDDDLTCYSLSKEVERDSAEAEGPFECYARVLPAVPAGLSR